jgi:hypothetical protein
VFEGLKLDYVDVGEVTLRVRHGGARQPLVQHGYPRIQRGTWAEGSHPGANAFVGSTGPVSLALWRQFAVPGIPVLASERTIAFV